MNKLRRWIKNWLARDEEYGLVVSNQIVGAKYDNDIIHTDGIKFTVTPANGGILISSHSFNNKKGESNTNLYIVHQNDEIAENITKIITLELLKKQ